MKQTIAFTLCIFFMCNFFTISFTAETDQALAQDRTKRYTLWVGSSLERVKAEWEKGLYAGFGQPVNIVTVDLKAKGVWHRTYVGNFSSKSEAEEFF